ncbi:MAG TPA: hypothetical protein ENI87_05945 [bacterium]|nr:hypothetical protein [bacterium]
MANPTCALLCFTLLPALATAQSDNRDRITRTDGRVVEGRLATPFATDEWLVVDGGKRTRVPVVEVATTDLVKDRVAEFFARRWRHRRSTRALGYLVDWAERRELHGLARLQALELVLQDDDNARLHEFLGHKRRGGEWRWPHDGKWLSFDKLTAAMLDTPLRLPGERFSLRCDAGLLTNVRALLDLERLAVAWFDEFGKELALREVLAPIEIRTFRNANAFPKWGFRPRPYFVPPPHDDLGRTFYAGPAPERPEDLFFLGTQGLLYRTLIGQGNRQDSRDRVCAWLEIGLGMHMQARMQGDAGFARPEKPRHLDLRALQALGRGYRLTHLVHLPMYASFYLTDDTHTATNWAAAQMFTAWLLDGDKQPATRAKFFSYAKAALRERKGDSSSLFDRIMGQRIEALEPAFHSWLNQLAGN